MRKVLKYGGTSVAGAEQMKAIAKYIGELKKQGDEIVVVVSAMGDTTDRLIDLADTVGGKENKREADALLSTGEIRSASLLAMAVCNEGMEAVSLTGFQAGIITDKSHTQANIKAIDLYRLKEKLSAGKVVVVAGFQGISEDGDITTLGRGGSDTTAVAIAAKLGCKCEIYTDVDGVYTRDPNLCPDACKIDFLTYDEMIAMAKGGAGILEQHSAELAKKYGVPVYIGKALERGKNGTNIGFAPINIAIVGAGGMVGRMFLRILEERQIRTGRVYLYAGANSAGSRVEFGGASLEIMELSEENIVGKSIDYAFFSAGGEVSLKYAPLFQKMGITVIDNSSAWRMAEDVPLVVPQVNARDVFGHKNIIANPNCSTIQCVIPLSVLHEKYTVKAVSFTTFQAVSGSGRRGTAELEATRKGGKPEIYPYPICNNCIPCIGDVLENGYTAEEMKMVNETRKILGIVHLSVTATCVRVPVVNGHCADIRVELEKDFDLSDIKQAFRASEAIVYSDDYPVTDMANGTDKVYIGRLRRDISNKNTLCLWCVADNIRKGAAANAIEIMELLMKGDADEL